MSSGCLERCQRCANRMDLALYLNELGLRRLAVEVGVWRGDFSDGFMERWKGRGIVLVDPWERLDPADYDDVRNRDFDPADYDRVRERMGRYGNRVSLWKGLSAEA